MTTTQTDTFGNTGTNGGQTITLDLTAPVVTLTSVNGTARTFPYTTNLAATSVGGACGTAAGDTATVSIVVTGASTQNGTAPCSAGAWTFTFATSLAATGTYSVLAVQSDAVGNSGTSGSQTINIDATAPVVTLTSVNGTARTFPYTTNLAATSVGGACGTAAGDNATVSVAVTGAGTQSGTTACSAGAWTFTFSARARRRPARTTSRRPRPIPRATPAPAAPR